jgi:hypothetical protein
LPTPTTDSQNDRSKPYAQGGTPLALAVKLLPTPTAQDAKNSTLPESQQERDSLPGALMRLLPTPTTSTGGSNNNSAAVKERGHGTNLVGAVHREVTARLLPTPVACTPTGGVKGLDGSSSARKVLAQEFGTDKISSLLNPRFVLQMMGFPSDWCDLTPAEIQQVRDERKQMKKHGGAARSTRPATP